MWELFGHESVLIHCDDDLKNICIKSGYLPMLCYESRLLSVSEDLCITTILQGGCAPAVIEDEISPGVAQCLSDYMTLITLALHLELGFFSGGSSKFSLGIAGTGH